LKVIIAGSRDIWCVERNVFEFVDSCPFRITEVVSGGARGVDRMGEYYAECNNLPIKRFTPDWEGYGKRAGFMRNTAMALYADALIAIWDGESKGTKHMIDEMHKLEKPVKVIVFPKPLNAG
jgi:hypothetical protein